MPRLYNFGSLCIDQVYRVERIAVAGQTIASRDHAVHPGGKGLNQSIAAARAGARVHHAGAIGADGLFLAQLLTDNGVGTDLVMQLDGASGHAIIQVDDEGANSIVISGGTNQRLPGAVIDSLTAAAVQGDWLLLQNETNHIDRALSQFRASPARVAMNLAPCDGREQDYDLSALDLLIVNAEEAAALVNVDLAEPRQALKQLLQRLPETQIVLTLGRDGLICADAQQQLELSAYSVVAQDETAAGDAFIGFLLAGLLENKPLIDCLIQASAAGALAVTRPGAASSLPERAAVAAFVAQQPALSSGAISL